MRIVQAKKHYSDQEAAERFPATQLTDDSCDFIAKDESTMVVKEDGSPLLIYCKGVLPLDQCKNAYNGLRRAAIDHKSDNRGMASGKGKVVGGEKAGIFSDTRFWPRKPDGTVSSTSYPIFSDKCRKMLKKYGGELYIERSDGSYVPYEPKTPMNGIAGFMDGNPRFPYCRLTAFNINRPNAFNQALPMIRSVDRVFGENLPERYANQQRVVESTSPDFFISGTVFTTLTINLNFQTAVHQDAGDLKEGFGVMAALRAGSFDGCYTVFPQYRVGADMQTGDVLLADVHEWHGNTPLHPKGKYERLSLVFYYREGMKNCGTATEELEKVKRSKGQTHLKGWSE